MKLTEVTQISFIIKSSTEQTITVFLRPQKITDLLHDNNSLGQFLRALVLTEDCSLGAVAPDC